MSVRAHKDALPIHLRDFRCKECGTVVPATKVRHKTKKGHIKHMYCFVCQTDTEHEQVE